MTSPQIEYESLRDQANRIEQEARMVLPGIQALFGFQLVAVFNDRFANALTDQQQVLHWLALAFTAIATMLTMAPVAFHRQAEQKIISERFVKYATLWLTISLVPLMLGFCIDFYLIGIVISKNENLSLLFSLILLGGFFGLWFVFPLIKKERRL